MITTSKGHPVEFIITPALVGDVTALKIMEISLPFDSAVYGDKAYTSYLFEDELIEFERIKLTPDRMVDSFRQYSGGVRYLQSVLRWLLIVEIKTNFIASLVVVLHYES